MKTRKIGFAAIAAGCVAMSGLLPTSVSGQDTSREVREASGAFQRGHGDASALLNAFQTNRAAVLAGLQRSNGGELSAGTHAQLLTSVERPPSRPDRPAGVGRRAEEVLTRAHELRRQLLDLYVAPGITDRRAAVEQAIDAYLSQPETALPARPRDRAIMEVLGGRATTAADADHAHGPHAHSGHEMPAASRASFGGRYPDVNRLLWAQQWMELALFEPVIRSNGTADREAGVREVGTRFRARLADSDDPRLSTMPTPAAISPELTMRHPRAAIILDNLYMLEMSLVDILASDLGPQRSDRIEQTVQSFLDPDHRSIDEIDWLTASLRRSVFLQGGPALGMMDRLDRNIGNIGDHRVRGEHLIMPGS